MSEALPEQRFSVLIVDDDDDVREALQDELELSYEVTAVSSGKEALLQLDERDYDAIISDQRMPGMSGVDVLEQAQAKNEDMVRILLTGFLDEDARRATLKDNAPFKIGKPWHDEVEVTLKRAFEHRAREKALSSSVSDALAVTGIDDELSAAENATQLAQVLSRRCHALRGVDACTVYSIEPQGERVYAQCSSPNASCEWGVDLPVTADGSIRLRAKGPSRMAEDIVRYLATRSVHWSSDDAATRLAKKANINPEARERLNAVSRRATLGTMTVSLVHELASVVQSLQGALFEIDDFIREVAEQEADEDVIDTLESAVETSSRMVSLFNAMRTFVRSGEVNHRPCSLKDLVDRSIALCRGQLRAIAKLDVSEIPDVELDVNEALFLQVLVNLLKNAAEASPHNEIIHLEIGADDDNVTFSVRDHGEGVPEDLVNDIFEPFTTSKEEHSGSGLGLAISAEIVANHNGTIDYQQAEDGGAIFSVTLPRHPVDPQAAVVEVPSDSLN